MNFERIIKDNLEYLNGKPIVYFSPGRVNLIGEHIDYLGGNVFPTAINLGTYAFVTRRDDLEVHFLSHNFKEYGQKIVTVDQLDFDEKRNWANYPAGMIQSFVKKGMNITHGMNILIYGTLPNGAGLSSSASLEVLMGVVLREQYYFDIKMIDIVKVAQYVENKYVGVNCGIMDQFAVGMSKKDHAIYLDTNSLEYQLVPLVLKDYTLVITNTNKRRALTESKYNERRQECELGLEQVNQLGFSVENLCDLTPVEFEVLQNKLDNGTVKNRIEHAVFENERVKKAINSLKSGDLIKFGKLMNLSHDSLRDLFEVSCFELDTVVDSFRRNGAIGSRMTGAGFGGCTISLVKTNIVESVIDDVSKEYAERTGYSASFYTCKTSDGAKRLKEEDVK
jgi:galactokinase